MSMILTTSQFLFLAAKGFCCGFIIGLSCLAVRLSRRAIFSVVKGPVSGF